MILSPSLVARGQLLGVQFHRVSMERCAGAAVGLGAHCLFQFCAGPYVWCPGPRRKERTHVVNCTVTPAVSQFHWQSSAHCSFLEVPVGILVESFQWFHVIVAD